MRLLLSLASLALAATPAFAAPPRPSSCPEGFEEVPLEHSGGTFNVTEGALARGAVCRPKPTAPARPVGPATSSTVANGASREIERLQHPAIAFADPVLTMNPPRPAPAGVSLRFIERTYDDFDRIESEKVPLENGGTATIRYTYWPDGRRKTLTDALGRVTFYEYDGRARLSRVTANQGLPDEHVTNYTYWPDGLLKTITKPNGVVTSYDYDRADRLTSVIVRAGPTVLLAYEYTYDPNGNRLTQVETNGGSPETTTYAYDDLNRLETVTYPDGVAVAYEYDAVGNRTRETTRSAAGVVVSDKRAAFDAINRLSSITDSVDPAQNATLAYDRNGNLLSKTTAAGTEEYAYDTRDFLVETRSGASITAHFAFDAFGRRYLKVGVDGTRQYLYDETSTLHELDGDDAEVAKYEYGGDRLLSLAHRGEPRRYYEQDGLGTPVALTDASGSVVARYHLDAWGRYRFPTELDASANRFGFTGYLFDQETDLYYAKARFYDPELGRFTTQDSVLGEADEPPSLNRYAYAHGNPFLYVDPTGHVVREAQALRGPNNEPLRVVAKDDTTVYANPTNAQLAEYVEKGELSRAEAVFGQVGNITRPLATTTPDYQKSWTRNFIEDSAENALWTITSPAHDTFEGLARQDGRQFATGLVTEVGSAALGLAAQEGVGSLVDRFRRLAKPIFVREGRTGAVLKPAAPAPASPSPVADIPPRVAGGSQGADVLEAPVLAPHGGARTAGRTATVEAAALEDGLRILEPSELHLMLGSERHHSVFRMLLRSFDKAGVSVRTAGGRMRPQRLVDLPTNTHQEFHGLWDTLYPQWARGSGASSRVARQIQRGETTPTEILDRLENFSNVALRGDAKLPDVLAQLRSMRGRIGQ